MKKKLFDRRGAGIELAILMMVVSFSMSILLTSVALIQSTKKVRAEERLQQSVALEQLGQDFLNAVLKGDVDGWITKGGHNKHYSDAHDWVEDTEKTAIDATCTTDGVKHLVCSICKRTKEEKIPKLEEHSYSEEIKGATCTETGEITYTCACGDSYTKTIPAGHQCNGEEKYENGVKVFTCTVCNETFEDGSSFVHSGVQTGTEEANCTAEGKKIFRCNCGEIYTENIPILEHSYEEKVTKEPTCNDAGEKTFTCETCGDESYTEEIPASHTWNDDNKCTLCDETKLFEGKWDDAYELIVYKNGDSFDVYVTITASNEEVCDGAPEGAGAEEENIEVAENAEPAGKQVLVIRVARDTEAEEITYKITEWTKNDRS